MKNCDAGTPEFQGKCNAATQDTQGTKFAGGQLPPFDGSLQGPNAVGSLGCEILFASGSSFAKQGFRQPWIS